VKLARFGDHTQSIIEICETCVKSPERFVQLGNGWVLRELSRADLNLVVSFIKKNYSHFSREGLRYAIEKMDEKLRQKLLKYNKSDGSDDSSSDSSDSDSGDSKSESMKESESEEDDSESEEKINSKKRKSQSEDKENAPKTKRMRKNK